MDAQQHNVIRTDKFPRNGGNGGRFDDRLRDLEIKVSAIDERLKHTATKAWVLAGVLGGMGVAAGVAVSLTLLIIRLVSK